MMSNSRGSNGTVLSKQDIDRIRHLASPSSPVTDTFSTTGCSYSQKANKSADHKSENRAEKMKYLGTMSVKVAHRSGRVEGDAIRKYKEEMRPKIAQNDQVKWMKSQLATAKALNERAKQVREKKEEEKELKARELEEEEDMIDEDVAEYLDRCEIEKTQREKQKNEFRTAITEQIKRKQNEKAIEEEREFQTGLAEQCSAKQATENEKKRKQLEKQQLFEKNRRLQMENRKVAEENARAQKQFSETERAMDLRYLETDPFPPHEPYKVTESFDQKKQNASSILLKKLKQDEENELQRIKRWREAASLAERRKVTEKREKQKRNKEQWLVGLQAQLEEQEETRHQSTMEDTQHYAEMLETQRREQEKANEQEQKELRKKKVYASQLAEQREKERHHSQQSDPKTVAYEERNAFRLKAEAEAKLINEEKQYILRQLNELSDVPDRIVDAVRSVK